MRTTSITVRRPTIPHPCFRNLQSSGDCAAIGDCHFCWDAPFRLHITYSIRTPWTSSTLLRHFRSRNPPHSYPAPWTGCIPESVNTHQLFASLSSIPDSMGQCPSCSEPGVMSNHRRETSHGKHRRSCSLCPLTSPRYISPTWFLLYTFTPSLLRHSII